MLSIVILTPHEEFLKFLDPELTEITETHSAGGLRTIEVDYKFQDSAEDKELFKIGNKIWIQGDPNLTDTLYVINTAVEQSLFKENSFTFEAEEVLVELNYAPLVTHLELSMSIFKTKRENGEITVRVDWNSLNYWFGNWFNIGVVQDCISDYVSYIPLTGTMTKMSLLRHIEEQTGNVFVTRYEKDCLDNTIHRYLDFLNPINVSKDWKLNLEYQFMGDLTAKSYDDDGVTVVAEDKAWNVTRFINDNLEPESVEEGTAPYDPDEDAAERAQYTEDSDYQWIAEDETWEDESTVKHYKSYHDIVAENLEFRLLDQYGNQLRIGDDDTAIKWTASDVDFSATDGTWLITLTQQGNVLGLCINENSFVVMPSEVATDYDYKYNQAIKNDELHPIPAEAETVIDDDCSFQIYDAVNDIELFRTRINCQVGKVHKEVLDFGFNLEDVQLNVDETSTYTAVSPILQLNNDNGTSSALTRTNLTDLMERYKDLKISKGQKIPMILQKVNVSTAEGTLEAAKASLGNYDPLHPTNHAVDLNGVKASENWWIRPYAPQDQINTQSPAQSTFEFIRATAYWNAPYSKKRGWQVETDKGYSTQYSQLIGRQDIRDTTAIPVKPKQGTTESSDEDIYAIYNQVVQYLKEHETPNVDVKVDVANLRGYEYNNYNIHDKIYIKLPDTKELVTARITETHKESNDIAKNSVKLSNYIGQNNIRTETMETLINASNLSFKYPASKTLVTQLENLAYDEDEDPQTKSHWLANKLLSFTLYSVKDGTETFRKNYTKVTNWEGKARLPVKLNPGDYIIEISFGGDEEYVETSKRIKVNVSGKKEVKVKKKAKTNKNKTTKNTTKKVTKTTYYDKYGRSPDKKKILAIGRPSASRDKGAYDFYGMEFKNKCPYCGHQSLYWSIFYAGNEHSNYGRFPATGRVEGGSAEGHIFCAHCDADFSCQGHEHEATKVSLKATKKRFKSTKADAYKLKKGKYIYNKKTTTVKNKNVKDNKNRKIKAKGLSKKVKDTALDIVGNKTGREAMLEICRWVDKHIGYTRYCGFCRSPDTVLSKGYCNCCDGTRLILQLFDAAGLTEYYDLYYVHVTGHVYAQIRTKKSGHRAYVDTASTLPCYGYVCQGYAHGSPSSTYPNKPFEGCQGGC